MRKTTMLLPTTTGVNEQISMQEAMSLLVTNNVKFEVVGEIVEGMYVSENGEIVGEKLLPISSDNLTAQQLATIFTQECILESDSNNAKLVAQDGSIWADFNQKVEYFLDNELQAIKLQSKLAQHFGGASRQGTKIWAWGDKDSLQTWAI